MTAKIRRTGFPTSTPRCRKWSRTAPKAECSDALPAISRQDSVIRNPQILQAFRPHTSFANSQTSRLETGWAKR